MYECNTILSLCTRKWLKLLFIWLCFLNCAIFFFTCCVRLPVWCHLFSFVFRDEVTLFNQTRCDTAKNECLRNARKPQLSLSLHMSALPYSHLELRFFTLFLRKKSVKIISVLTNFLDRIRGGWLAIIRRVHYTFLVFSSVSSMSHRCPYFARSHHRHITRIRYTVWEAHTKTHKLC